MIYWRKPHPSTNIKIINEARSKCFECGTFALVFAFYCILQNLGNRNWAMLQNLKCCLSTCHNESTAAADWAFEAVSASTSKFLEVIVNVQRRDSKQTAHRLAASTWTPPLTPLRRYIVSSERASLLSHCTNQYTNLEEPRAPLSITYSQLLLSVS